MTAARKLSGVESDAAPRDPVLEAFARAPMGPADPPEVRAAIREGKALGDFASGRAVTAEIARRRRAWSKPGK